jgi:hypothetical protein
MRESVSIYNHLIMKKICITKSDKIFLNLT